MNTLLRETERPQLVQLISERRKSGFITAYKWLYREKNKKKQEFFNLLEKGTTRIKRWKLKVKQTSIEICSNAQH